MIWKPVLVGLVAALGPCVSGAEEGNVAAPPGVLVDVGTHKMNLRCVGAGSPAVILEAGMGDDSRRWSAVLERAPKRFRTCAYDRAGSGASEPGPGPRTMRQEVFELHALLKAASVSGPYVLVGHSYGGLLARLYTAAYPKDVIGLVLVDATHEDTRLFMQRPGEPAGKLVRIRDGARGRIVPPARETMAPASSAPDEDYWAEELQEMHESGKAAPEPL
jgi:pimeloyl-ACP methyl ester carboxylesterase